MKSDVYINETYKTYFWIKIKINKSAAFIYFEHVTE